MTLGRLFEMSRHSALTCDSGNGRGHPNRESPVTLIRVLAYV